MNDIKSLTVSQMAVLVNRYQPNKANKLKANPRVISAKFLTAPQRVRIAIPESRQHFLPVSTKQYPWWNRDYSYRRR